MGGTFSLTWDKELIKNGCTDTQFKRIHRQGKDVSDWTTGLWGDFDLRISIRLQLDPFEALRLSRGP